jgi:hypothetical protein
VKHFNGNRAAGGIQAERAASLLSPWRAELRVAGRQSLSAWIDRGAGRFGASFRVTRQRAVHNDLWIEVWPRFILLVLRQPMKNRATRVCTFRGGLAPHSRRRKMKNWRT